jgi:hypothetical protein
LPSSACAMSSSLRTRLGELVSTLAAGIVDAIRGASLEEISGEGPSDAAVTPRKSREPAPAVRAAANPPRSVRSVPPRHAAPARAVPARRAPARRAPARTAPARTAPARAERLPRRSPTDIAAVVEQIARLLAEHREGLRAEQIRAALGVSPAELPRPLKEGLATRRFAKSGEKRATTYTLRTPKPSASKNAKSAKSVAARPAASSAAPPAPAAAPAPASDGTDEAWEERPALGPDPSAQET